MAVTWFSQKMSVVSVSAKAVTLVCILHFVHKPGQGEDEKVKRDNTETLHVRFL